MLKEGLAEDRANRDKILPLLRFASTREEGNEPTVSLAQYVERMKAGPGAHLLRHRRQRRLRRAPAPTSSS